MNIGHIAILDNPNEETVSSAINHPETPAHILRVLSDAKYLDVDEMFNIGMVRVEAEPDPSPQDEASAYTGRPQAIAPSVSDHIRRPISVQSQPVNSRIRFSS